MPTDGETKGSARAIIVILHTVVVMVLVLFSQTYQASGFTYDELVYPLCLVLTLLSVWMLWTWKRLTGSLFDPYGMFLLAAILFNAGQAILETFHLNAKGLLDNRFDGETLFKALMLTATGLAGFHLGGIVNVVAARPDTLRTSVASRVDESAFRFVGWVLFAVSIIPTFITARSAIAIASSGGYSSIYQQEQNLGVQAAPQLLAGLIVPATILILLGARNSSAQIRFSAAVIIFYALIQFFVGYRAHAVMPVAAYAWAYHRSVRPIPRSFLLGAASIVLFVIFPMVRATRIVAGEERLSPSFLWKSYVSIENPIVAILAEVGGSLSTTAWTTVLVPVFRPHDMGVGYLYAMSTVVPNIFGGVHPAVARGSASTWLVNTVDPYTAAQKGGFGYSFIAEAYLSFGALGSVVALFVIGFALSNLFYRSIRSADLRLVGFSACFFAFLSLYARGESILIFRPLVWYSVIPILLVIVLSTKRVPSPRSLTTGAPYASTPTTSIGSNRTTA